MDDNCRSNPIWLSLLRRGGGVSRVTEGSRGVPSVNRDVEKMWESVGGP